MNDSGKKEVFWEVVEKVTLKELQGNSELGHALVVAAFSIGQEEELFRFLFERDIKSAPIFREENPSVICLRALFEVLNGKETITSLLHSSLSNHPQFLQPNQSMDTGVITDVVDNILDIFLGAGVALGGMQQCFLATFGWVFGILKSVLEEAAGISEPALPLISSIFFLRFVTPILCNPYGNKLVPEPINSRVFHQFVLLAKTLQAVANNKTDFKLNNQEMKQYLSTSHQQALSFASSFVTLPFTPPPPLFLPSSSSFALLEAYSKNPTSFIPPPQPSPCFSPRAPSPRSPRSPPFNLAPVVAVVFICIVATVIVNTYSRFKLFSASSP